MAPEGATSSIAVEGGTARRLEPAATNDCTNPSFEVDLSGWAASLATITRIADAPAVGDWAARVMATSGSGRHGVRHEGNAIVSGGQAVTASTYARRGSGVDWCVFGDAGDTTWHRAFFNLATGVVGGTHGAIASARIDDASAERGPGWWRLIVTYTHDAGGTGNVWLSFEIVAADGNTGGFVAAGGETHDADGASIVLDETEPTSYLEGTLGEGYAWTGATRVSSSTRAAGRLTLPAGAIDTVRGSAIAWLRPAWPGYATAEHVVFELAGGPSRSLSLAHSEGAWRLAAAGAGATAEVSIAATHPLVEWVCVAATWGRTTLTLHLDGERATARSPSRWSRRRSASGARTAVR